MNLKAVLLGTFYFHYFTLSSFLVFFYICLCTYIYINYIIYNRFFKGTFQYAEKYALRKSKFIILYVESERSKNVNSAFRKAIADNTVGNYINEQVIVYLYLNIFILLRNIIN